MQPVPAIVFGLLWNVGLATALAALFRIICSFRSLQRRPALVHTLWLLVLVKLVTPPLIPVPVLSQIAQEVSGASSVPLPDAASESSIQFSREIPPATFEAPGTHSASVPRQFGISWLLLLTVGSAVGTVILVMTTCSRLMFVTRVLRHAAIGDERLARLAQSSAQRMGLAASPRILAVDAPIVPFLWITFRGPVVILPTKLIEPMSDEQIICILCHELAHYVRKDHWVNLFAFVVTALFWWCPIAWWAWRHMRIAQEVCCDALVLEAKPAERRCYAETLFQALEFVQTCQPVLPRVASGFGDQSSLMRRFQMIATLHVKPRISRMAAILAVAGVAAMFCVPVRGQSPVTVTGPNHKKNGEKKNSEEQPKQEGRESPWARPVPFSFEASKLTWTSGKKLDAKEEVAFGETDHGLQLGVKLLREPAEYRANEEMKYELVIRNAGKEPVRFVFWQPQQPAAIADSDGKRISLVWYEPLFSSLPTFISLAPEEAYRLKYSMDLKPAPKDSGRLGPWWESPQPGQYKLALGIYLDIVPSDAPNPEKATQIFPGSGRIPLRIVDKSREE